MKRSHVLALMTAILLLAALLRFYRLDYQSFWNDEGNSARLSERTIPLIIEGTASDIHPPLYYLLLKGWRTGAGDSEFGLRSVSALMGVILVATTFALGRRLLGSGSQWVSVTAAFMAAVNPILVYYSQEARMYELLALVGVASSLLLIRLLEKPDHRPAVAVAYGLCTAAGLYTHYYFPVVLIPQFFMLAVWLLSSSDPNVVRKRQAVWLVVGALVLAFLVYLPWLPVFFRQIGGRQTDKANAVEYFVDNARWLSLGDFLPLNEANYLLLIFTVLIAAGLIIWTATGRIRLNKSFIILAAMLTPLLTMWLLGTSEPVFYKFTLMVFPWMATAASLGLILIVRLKKGRFSIPLNALILLVVGGIFLWTTSRALWNMYDDPAFARADYRGITEQIKNEDHPDSAVVLNAANQWEVFTYYHDKNQGDSRPVLPIPRGYPDAALIHSELDEIISSNSRIYALFWGEAERDPQRLVERWLDSHAFKAREEWVGDVRFATYAVQTSLSDHEPMDLNILFGKEIRLESVAFTTQEVRPGDIFAVTLTWSAETELDERYKVFLHLVNNEGQLVTQRDSEPGGGLALTTTWNAGENVEDKHGIFLPEDLKPGVYELVLGIYPLGEPYNRLTYLSSGSENDAYPLTKITIPPDTGSKEP